MTLDPRAVATAGRAALPELGRATAAQKNKALLRMGDLLDERRDAIAAANEADLAAAADAGLPDTLVARLRFGPAKIDSRIQSLQRIANLPDPVGSTVRARRCDNGLAMQQVRVPLGVILMIYEARPHVTVNAGAFCLKAGNAAVLRGGSEARRCNELLGTLWTEAAEAADLPPAAVQVVAGSHAEVQGFLELSDLVDLVIPRGGKKLIETVSAASRIPVIKHDAGLCHVYIDATADPDTAVAVAYDSKCLMPEVCNAAETVLVHSDWAPHLPGLIAAFRQAGVEVRGCSRTAAAADGVVPATEEDWATEYLDLVVSLRVVDNTEEAIAHINRYGSHHTDAVVTGACQTAERFARDVDSALAMLNTSTMFCDGVTLGMGAEIGISTDRLHARGLMGLEELTTTRTVVRGTGQIMGPRP